jgi:hypothetical protein
MTSPTEDFDLGSTTGLGEVKAGARFATEGCNELSSALAGWLWYELHKAVFARRAST